MFCSYVFGIKDAESRRSSYPAKIATGKNDNFLDNESVLPKMVRFVPRILPPKWKVQLFISMIPAIAISLMSFYQSRCSYFCLGTTAVRNTMPTIAFDICNPILHGNAFSSKNLASLLEAHVVRKCKCVLWSTAAPEPAKHTGAVCPAKIGAWIARPFFWKSVSVCARLWNLFLQWLKWREKEK